MMMRVAYVAVLALLACSVRADDDDHKRSQLFAKLLRLGGGEVAAKLLPGLNHVQIGDVRAISRDSVEVSRLAFSLDSTTQDVDGLLTDVTIDGINALKVTRKGRDISVSGDLTIAGNYELSGTVREGTLQGAGAISASVTGFEFSATSDSTAIDDTHFNVNSVTLSVAAPSITVNYENLVLETSAAKLLKKLLA